MPVKSDIRKVMEGSVSRWKGDRLVKTLLSNADQAEELLFHHRLDLALRARCESRNRELEAAIMASIKGASPTAFGRRTMHEIARVKLGKRSQWGIGGWRAPVVAAAAVILLAGASLWRSRDSVPVGTLVSEVGALWEGDDAPRVGGAIRGEWKLRSGVAEFRTNDGALVAIEGPAEFSVRSPRFMELKWGAMRAHVPRSASGFAVETPTGRVVDIGTRFGVVAEAGGHTETHVFEGHVQVEPVRRFGPTRRDLRAGDGVAFDPLTGTAREIKADSARFPRSSTRLTGLLVGGNWEPDEPRRVGGIPTKFATWGGDDAEVISQWKKIRPFEGKGMLRLTSNKSSDGSPDHRVGNEQWQFVDLQAHAEAIEQGGVVVEASMHLRQVGGRTSRARLILAGFDLDASKVGPVVATGRHSAMTAIATGTVATDGKSADWQRIETRLELPPNTRFIYMNPRVEIGSNPDPKVAYLIDSLQLHLVIPPRPSSSEAR